MLQFRYRYLVVASIEGFFATNSSCLSRDACAICCLTVSLLFCQGAFRTCLSFLLRRFLARSVKQVTRRNVPGRCISHADFPESHQALSRKISCNGIVRRSDGFPSLKLISISSICRAASLQSRSIVVSDGLQIRELKELPKPITSNSSGMRTPLERISIIKVTAILSSPVKKAVGRSLLEAFR